MGKGKKFGAKNVSGKKWSRDEQRYQIRGTAADTLEFKRDLLKCFKFTRFMASTLLSFAFTQL